MLPGRGAGGGRPAALPRLLRELRPGPVLPPGRPRRRVRPLAALLAHRARGARRPGGHARIRARPARRARRRWRSSPGWRPSRRWLSDASRTRTPTALALALGAILLARRSPAGAGALAGVAFAFRFDVGARRGRWAPRSPPADARGGRRVRLGAAALAGAVLVLPFVARRARRRSGTTRSASSSTSRASSACRCPGAYDGGFEPNKTARLLHAVRADGRARRSGWSPRCARARRSGSGPRSRWRSPGSPTCSPARTSSIWCPLAAVLPVLLAGAAGHARAHALEAGARRAGRRSSR